MTRASGAHIDNVLSAVRAGEWKEEHPDSPATAPPKPALPVEIPDLVLNTREQMLVRELLCERATELFHEIHHTDSRAMREDLRKQVVDIEMLIVRIPRPPEG